MPLTDALPWEVPPAHHRTLVVNDSIGTDGRFLLYTLASQVFSAVSSEGRCLWLACGSVTEPQILQGLKKIGCDKSVISKAKLWSNKKQQQVEQVETTASPSLSIRSVACDISMQLQNPDAEFEEQIYLKRIYQYIQSWLTEEDGNNKRNWIILDDVSALANLLGERLVYSFLMKLNSKRHGKYGLMIRCSNDSEQESLPTLAGSSLASGPDWFGAGGLSSPQSTICEIPWERSLLEIADGIMDVLPLTSGYTRELHGRIVFTQLPQGLGWGYQGRKSSNKMASPMQIINYCITDNKIVAYVL